MSQKKKRSNAKTKKRTKKKTPAFKMTWRANGVILFLFAVIALLDLGFLGTFFSNIVRIFVGQTYQFALVILLFIGCIALLFNKVSQLFDKRFLGIAVIYSAILLFVSAYTYQAEAIHTGFFKLFFDRLSHDLFTNTLNEALSGGLIGVTLYAVAYFLIGQLGSYLLAICILFIGIFLTLDIPLSDVLEQVVTSFKAAFTKTREFLQAQRKKRVEQKEAVEEAELVEQAESLSEENSPKVFDQFETNIPVENSKKLIEPKENKKRAEKTELKKTEAKVRQKTGDYVLPSVELLTQVAESDQSAEKERIKHNQVVLTDTLESFGVKADLKNIILGPAVTKYELHPDIGVKVSKFVSLADDLALALAAKDIRIEAPIPGKALVGIEVPNINVAAVSFKDVMSEFQKTEHSPLEVPLGRDISNELITANLAKMPHLLIAGSTGSGKSVAINVILSSLLMNCLPEQVKLVLIDPKKVELGMYHDLPHLLTPVVTESKKAAITLRKVVAKMEERYELFAKTGQRNLEGYNRFAAKDPANYEQMPYIVVIVDELADLMMTTGNEVEDAITRIAQMGRAAGIHMILATQRPSVDVITGIIKANVPSRIAFAVSSGIDSRTIIDQSGAEKLLGRGDMLYLPMGQNKPNRVQGAYIHDDDVQKLVDFIKKQAEVDYDQTLEVSENDLKDPEERDADEFFEQVVDFIAKEQKCSTSLLQRRFHIGYNRAATLVEELENRGMIGPQAGAKPRQVYIKPKND